MIAELVQAINFAIFKPYKKGRQPVYTLNDLSELSSRLHISLNNPKPSFFNGI